MNCKLLTGRNFANTCGRSSFFKSGFTKASFQSEGKYPHARDEFTMRVMTGKSSSKQDRTSDVGTGSNSQDFLADRANMKKGISKRKKDPVFSRFQEFSV